MRPWLAERGRYQPDAPAIFWQGDTYTYGQLAERVARRAAILADRGVDAGSRVALLGGNSLEYVCAVHATFWLGGTLVPLNAGLAGAELEAQYDEMAPDLLLVDERVGWGLGRPGAMALEELAERADRRDEGVRAAEVDPETPATIFYTSGTTGRPKPVPLTWANHLASASASAFNLGIAPEERWLASLPLYHVGGLAVVVRSAIYGTAVDLMADFEAERVAAYLADRPVTLASFVPTMVRRLFEVAARPGDGLRAGLVGGGPADADLLEVCRERGFPARPTWGMTETASQFATLPEGRRLGEPGNVGPPLFGGEVRIVDGEGRRVPTGVAGQIQVRGPMVFDGYVDRPARNDQAFVDGWFDTGDVGGRNDRGDLIVEARRSERIVTGGENVDPREVEAALREHPSVDEACVVGLPDPEWGEIVAAAVESTGAGATVEALRTHCRRSLARFKSPKRWNIVSQLPRTGSHKIDRRRVRQQFGSPRQEE